MTIPVELQRTTPRQVSLTFWGKAAVLSFVLLLVAFIAEIAGLYPRGSSRGLSGTVGFLGLYLLIVLATILWKIPHQIHLLSLGRAAVARTTGNYKRVKFTGEKNVRRYRLECEFTSLSGGRSKTTVVTSRWLPANSEVVIVYDPDEPNRAAIYPARMLKIESS